MAPTTTPSAGCLTEGGERELIPQSHPYVKVPLRDVVPEFSDALSVCVVKWFPLRIARRSGRRTRKSSWRAGSAASHTAGWVHANMLTLKEKSSCDS